jgi:hypothetical protein
MINNSNKEKNNNNGTRAIEVREKKSNSKRRRVVVQVRAILYIKITVCHGLGYFGILLAISWPRIFWGYFRQYHGLGYFGTSMVQGYIRR